MTQKIPSLFFKPDSKKARDSTVSVLHPLAEKIYFPEIAYKSQPFVWKYNRKNNTATSSFELLATDQESNRVKAGQYTRAELIEYLKKHQEDISISASHAIINDVSLLRYKYPAISIHDYSKPQKALSNTLAKGNTTPASRPKQSVEEVYFPSIAINGNPYLWYYYREYNLALWTDKLLEGGTEKYSDSDLISKLLQIPGVIEKNKQMAITNVYDFSLKHSMKYYDEDETLSNYNALV
ncbi:hypothetical protein Lbir_3175 [Legionella birminghamensis]|uniref:Uncharacterized protein n=1 Tax=Legionella birminghamensis TaxID=28083 RepID=A0A378ICN9_9GAMM|nr:hypothetical protein [Legionella birminghamensis]KTC66873.1 hypothetical protein Lbir_3175 [Legionella birminghamensis]STX32998.1 Uncharacterised protein [Legionella birminghamensis]